MKVPKLSRSLTIMTYQRYPTIIDECYHNTKRIGFIREGETITKYYHEADRGKIEWLKDNYHRYKKYDPLFNMKMNEYNIKHRIDIVTDF